MKKVLRLIGPFLLFWSGLVSAYSCPYSSNFSVTFTLESAPITNVAWDVEYGSDNKFDRLLIVSPKISQVGQSASTDNDGKCENEPDQSDTIFINFNTNSIEGLTTLNYDPTTCNSWVNWDPAISAFQVESGQLQIDTANFNGFILGNIKLTLYPSQDNPYQGTVYCNYDNISYIGMSGMS